MYHVLIVDDEPIILHGLQGILEWEEYGLEIAGLAANGVQAREIIGSTPIDILLTDIKMPEMNGLELIDFIRHQDLNIKVIVLSGYDDFNYVKGAIKLGVENYLLKPVNKEELSLTLLNVLDKIEKESRKESYEAKSKDVFRQNLLYRWVSDNISLRDLQERAALIGIRLDYAGYQAATLYLLDNLDSPQRDLTGNAILELCGGARTAEISPLIFSDLDDNVILLFSDDHLDAKRQDILDYLRRCVTRINAELAVNVFAALGTVESDFRNVGKSYLAARNLQEYSLVYPPNSILTDADIRKSAADRPAGIPFDFEILAEHLISRRKDEAISFIKEYYHQLLSTEGITPKDIQNLSVEVLYNLSGFYKKAIRNYDIPPDLEILFSDLNKVKTSQELIDWIALTISKMIDGLAFCDENQNPLIKHIIRHVNNHYQEALSLKTISALHNVNTSYLGQLFKNETGELFTNYLNGVRIQKARELLAQTNLKVYDISNKVGYVNQSLFFRTFKKLTGLSPEEFRERGSMA